jgi:hypothetical protein
MDRNNSTTLVIKDFQGVKIHSFISPYPYAAQDAFKAQLLEAYPHRESPMMFDLYLGFLFGQTGSH